MNCSYVGETEMVATVSNSKMIATERLKQVGCLSSSERGQLCIVNECYEYLMSPFIILQLLLNPKATSGATSNYWAECNEEAQITLKIFVKCFRMFVSRSGTLGSNTITLYNIRLTCRPCEKCRCLFNLATDYDVGTGTISYPPNRISGKFGKKVNIKSSPN